MLINILLNISIGFVIVYQINGFPLSKNGSFKNGKPTENSNLFEGDMRFPATSSSLRGAIRRGNSVAWTNGIVPYEISSEYEAPQRSFLVAMMLKLERLIAINNVACIQFRPRISSDQYYIRIRDGEGCSSFVGQNTGVDMERTLTLGYPECFVEGIVLHELLHVLGFFHEQSRPDRDNYVKINYENIQPDMELNFEKYPNSQVNIEISPYDYSSIMHYDRYSFSLNDFPTIEPLQANVEIGQRQNLSLIDIQEVRFVYRCSSTGITLPPIQTVNVRSWNTTISSALTRNCLTFDRIEFSDGRYYYESYDIRVSLDGYYMFTSKSSIDTYGYLYSKEFKSNCPYTNLLEMDDESGGSSQFQITVFLESNHKYILVVTTYSQSISGTYELIASGPFIFDIKKLNNISPTFSTVRSTTTTTPKEIISQYSSVLTTNSLTYTRFRAKGRYYYEAIQILNSTVDGYGYLYLKEFDPFNPKDRLLSDDDDTAANSQFLIEYSLQANQIYILIQTTYDENKITPFTIISSGHGKTRFSHMDRPRATR